MSAYFIRSIMRRHRPYGRDIPSSPELKRARFALRLSIVSAVMSGGALAFAIVALGRKLGWW